MATPDTVTAEDRLQDTRAAFDSVAADYAGTRGNNDLVQHMRWRLRRAVDAVAPRPARLLDLGCGPGLDAVHFAQEGHNVLATDWSPEMIRQAETRVIDAGVARSVSCMLLGIHELHLLAAPPFDVIYSSLGPMNCVPDLPEAAAQCARLLTPGGAFIATVIGRLCPWEYVYFRLRGNQSRARVRLQRGAVPVRLNRCTVWSNYYRPREFYRPFARDFALTGYCGLNLFLPPPYLIRYWERHPRLCRLLRALDQSLAGLPVFRESGDHFLIVLRRRA